MQDEKFFLLRDLPYRLSIAPTDLSFLDLRHGPEVLFFAGTIRQSRIPAGDLDIFMPQKFLEDLLREAGGSVGRAAELAGLHRSTLYEKLARYGLVDRDAKA
mgnify:CR=1 FL=1